ncbi:hypothetical protein [Burkholderia ubonensis]|uniref:hypothetical protein n=1 Tax=Burkholderia ubonensis TaxID=101571 RepID=UPI0012FE254A|nr:hypothetical protein [Burkholderia ubonensis]
MIDIQKGTIIADSVGQAIERFRDEVGANHFRDPSSDGKRPCAIPPTIACPDSSGT